MRYNLQWPERPYQANIDFSAWYTNECIDPVLFAKSAQFHFLLKSQTSI